MEDGFIDFSYAAEKQTGGQKGRPFVVGSGFAITP
jgi:hypothetical protein